MLSKLQMKLEIPKRAKNCYLCSHQFQPGEVYHSVLSEDVKEGLVRSDYCQNCRSKALIDRITASWTCHVPDKKDVDSLPKDKDEKALLLLQQALSGDKESQCIETNFLIALYLQRKKVLILRKEITDDHNNCHFLFEIAETEEMLPVQKVSISPGRIQELQKKVADVINS